tara:strand:+ start:200 stop:496 length:297 start_codon:yes stop_codon:yes gene_type:complete
MSGPYPIPSGSQINQFETFGHPGRYTSALSYASGQLDLTGSNYGYGAVIMKTPGGATIHLSDGGTILAANLPNDVIELSVSKITGGTASVIYVLKRQQ